LFNSKLIGRKLGFNRFNENAAPDVLTTFKSKAYFKNFRNTWNGYCSSTSVSYWI